MGQKCLENPPADCPSGPKAQDPIRISKVRCCSKWRLERKDTIDTSSPPIIGRSHQSGQSAHPENGDCNTQDRTKAQLVKRFGLEAGGESEKTAPKKMGFMSGRKSFREKKQKAGDPRRSVSVEAEDRKGKDALPPAAAPAPREKGKARERSRSPAGRHAQEPRSKEAPDAKPRSKEPPPREPEREREEDSASERTPSQFSDSSAEERFKRQKAAHKKRRNSATERRKKSRQSAQKLWRRGGVLR